MPRNMSFTLTCEQIRNQSKTVTRRFGWNFLKVGDVINAVEKSMGLKKGEKVFKLGQIRILSIRNEPLNAINKDECIKEGFPDWEPKEFVAMIRRKFKCECDAIVNRIEFKYIKEPKKC